MAKDPVCGMEVEEGKICSEFEGKRYCFCCEACRETFEKEPSRYLKENSPEEKGCC
ncbi:MAG: YHS domain-containing protein [bacterium]|nr:YHS domain-containing protein [bacterium]